MPKTYTAAGTVAAGDVYTASAHNIIATDVNNFIVPPAARILLTSNVSVANGSHTDFAGFTSTNATEDYDTDGMVTLSASASAMTVQTAGIYQVNATIIFGPNGVGSRVGRIVRSSGGTLTAIGACNLPPPPAVNGAFSTTVSGFASFAVGDLIRLMVYQASGGPLNLQTIDGNAEYAQTQLSAAWIGRTS
jgi:hypothetical protein